MIILAVLEGYSRSTSPVDLSDMTEALLKGEVYKRLIKKAWLGKHQVRRFVGFVQENESEENVLLLVGKSLGGRNIIRVFNLIDVNAYKAVVLFTIDVNWPTWRDLSPNLNKISVAMNDDADMAVNVYLRTPNKRLQAGCRVDRAFNIPIVDPTVTHRNIIGARPVRDNLYHAVKFAIGCQNKKGTE